MSVAWFSVTVDAHDPPALARWWAEALGFEVIFERPGQSAIADSGGFPGILFIENDTPKTTKNRLHFDLNPDDQAAEVERLSRLGATRLDIGQPPDASWVVMADPEGNEFCVLAPWPPAPEAG